MEYGTKPDLHISGSGSNGGGDYGKVAISGSGRIDGEINADKVTVSGSAQMNQDVTSAEIRVSGSCRVEGSLSTHALHVSGSLSVGKNATVANATVTGSFRVTGDMLCENISASGLLDIDGDVKADILKASVLRCHKDVEAGAIEISGGLVDGLLNAETIDVRLAGTLRCREIGCRRLIVRPVKVFGFFTNRELECDQIEGDQLELYRTRARVVRGDTVIVGKGCRLERVEYRHRIEVDADAQVIESVQIES